MSGPLISVQALDKSFSGPDGHAVPVLEGITLDVQEGEFVALLGRSGSGKSTLLRCIAGLIAPTAGHVLFRGRRLTGTNRDTTMVFQTFALLPWLTVQQNVELGLEARGVAPAERSERALRAIDVVGLDGYESAYPKELSGGMRQRVGFARALVVEPAALLMDEPFSALDVLTSENLRGELLELWEGKRFPTKTMIMVTHNIEEAVLLADRLLVLGTNPGRIKADMRNPLPRPRRRRTPDFEELVDQIYRMMTQRDGVTATAPGGPSAGAGDPGGPGGTGGAEGSAGPGSGGGDGGGTARHAGETGGTIGDTPLPHATVDGFSGLAEVLLGRYDGVADLPDLADSLGLEVDDLLPLVDALVLLGFAGLRGERLELSPGGRTFAGASIQESKERFARACLDRAPLVRTIYKALRGSPDGNLPAGFFTSILAARFGEDEAARQLDVAVNWGRYAELYAYDATRGQIIREDQGIGATLAGMPEPGRRGTLHLYLGAAPGSGKTFTMLRDGRALRDRDEDVVVGLAEPRGRPRTEEAMAGLETVPPASSGDMDLDAVLARRPAVVLVDDFGRHQPAIATLRDAGIDVISTVDVTDLERAAEPVRELTGRPVAATVSDTALAEADEIRFVDNSPEALRKRLGHGNIYPRAQAAEALDGLFSTPSLAALREIGLGVVAGTLTAAGDARQPGPRDVLVAVTVAGRADALVRRGIRLARRGGARCVVLLPTRRPGLPAPGWAAGQPPALDARATAAARTVALNSGATVITRETQDLIATIADAVRESGARHLVIAEPVARLLERRRPSLAERLADRLPEVTLHITPGQPAAGGAGADRVAEAGAADAGRPPPRGTIRLYLGYAVGVGVTTAMLEEAGRRKSRGSDVIVAAVDGRDREGVSAALEGLELVGDGSALDADAVLARHPEVACIDDVSGVDPGGASRFAAARRLADAGINVVATVHLASLRHIDASSGRPDEEAVVALADEIEIVDTAPSVLTERVRRGEIVPEEAAGQALRTDYAPQVLAALREETFRIVAGHASRSLAGAGVRGDDGAAPPVILGCVAPRPGMEPLIRRAAAVAAQLAGDFLVAVAQPPAPAAPDGDGALLAGYQALTARLGGQFAVLDGSPARALLGFARQHQVTEMVLSRGRPPAGRHLVLRELARSTGEAELHILPAATREGPG